MPDGVAALRAFAPHLMVTAAFGQILSAENLSIPKFGCINVHGSLLPKYRGAAPIQWAVINGEKETGVTTMMTDVGLDTGDILMAKKPRSARTKRRENCLKGLPCSAQRCFRIPLRRLQ